MTLRDIGKTVSDSVLKQVGRAASQVQENRPLPVDVLESDDAYLVVFDAPGATQSDVQVRYIEGAVEVRIDRFRQFYEEFEMRVPGRGMSLDGHAKLPADALVNAEDAKATLRKNGTLEIEIPKEEGGETEESGDTVTIAEPDEGDDEPFDDEDFDE
ncbi:Hsp20/alpha crystallin family protein [Haloarchaeobius amylolyticus]|uniref:Hsp20/alpha crystallin family protein n=1 Tax=Haloarchaeobius amylolyticus TaxID=1198296 RepID=UPI00226E12D1|nr:Hsp20/alpha crystallin family protein [Haloarchaeobius amylolyticus]